jgi:uncharacterized membrane protein
MHHPERRATTDRLGWFSDGVFTIAMTIMVFQLKPPEDSTFTALLALWPTGLSYVVSYCFIAIVWLNHNHLFRFFPDLTPRLVWINFVHLFMVTLVPFSTAWVARTKLAAVPVFAYAAVFVLVNLAYIPFEWHALAFAPDELISARTRRLAKTRSSVTLGIFVVAMLVSLKFPSLGFGLVCCALLLYLRPELPGVGSEDAGEIPSSSASPRRREQENTVRD